MDLSRFDTRDAAESGVDIPLVINGETVYGDDDQPVMFRLKGIADRDVHALMLKAKPGKTPQEVLDADLRLAQVAVVGWSDNFTVRGEKIPYSRENVRRVMENPLVRRSVLAEVWNESNFMPKL